MSGNIFNGNGTKGPMGAPNMAREKQKTLGAISFVKLPSSLDFLQNSGGYFNSPIYGPVQLYNRNSVINYVNGLKNELKATESPDRIAAIKNEAYSIMLLIPSMHNDFASRGKLEGIYHPHY